MTSAVLVAAGGAAWEAAVLRDIEAHSRLRLARRCLDVAELTALALDGHGRFAVTDLGLPGLDVDTVHRVRGAGVRVVGVGDPARGLALGIDETVDSAAVVAALAALAQEEPGPARSEADPGGAAPLVVVWGPSGAPGRSTVALSLAAAHAAAGIETALVDADLDGGSLGQLVGVLDDVSGLGAACRAANQGDTDGILAPLISLAERLRLLTGVPRAQMWTQARPGAVDRVVDTLRAVAGRVIVDVGSSIEESPQGRHEVTRRLLRDADHVVVVGRADPVGLARLVRALHDLDALLPGTDAGRTVVLNHVRQSLGWSTREVDDVVERLSGRRPDAHLPFDQTSLDLATISGRLPARVAPDSAFIRAVSELAFATAGEPVRA